MPKITVYRGNLDEHDSWLRHRLAYNMGLWDFSYVYAVNTMAIDQEIDGVKTFYNFPVLPVGFPLEDTQAANKFYVDYVSQRSVTFENLFANGDVGVGANQVARGNHTHVNLPTDDQKDAMDTAQNPNAANPFLTWSPFSQHANRHTISGQDKIDNVTITTPGLMSFEDKIKLDDINRVCGVMYTHDTVIQIDAAVANNAYLINGLTDGYVTSDTTKIIRIGSIGRFTVKLDGIYGISYDASFSTNKSCVVHFHLYLNGIRRGECSFRRDIVAPVDIGSGATSTILELTSNAFLEVKVETNTNNVLVDIEHMNFYIFRI